MLASPRHRLVAATGAAALGLVLVVPLLAQPSAAAPVAVASSAAAENTAPLAPNGLLTNSMPAPGTVEGAPAFSWFVRDDDRDEVQGAYEIEVLRAGAVEWTSGKVASSEQSAVVYSGPALASATAFEWRVRTWDGSDAVSPWSTNARFATGIDDAEWGASWLWRAQSSQRNQWTTLRREVPLTGAPATITRATAYVASVHEYELFVGGQSAGRGESYTYPGEGYYQAHDIRSRIGTSGQLVLGATAHWFSGGQGRATSAPGFLARVVVEYADGSTQVVTTDDSWKVVDGPYGGQERRNGEGDIIEELDARTVPVGWAAPGFDDSAWTPATVRGAHPVAPFTDLTGQQTAMTTSTVRPVARTVTPDGATVFDFGRVLPGRPVVRFDTGVAGRPVEIATAYRLTADGHASRSDFDNQRTNMLWRYTQVDGPQTYRAFDHLGFRYLEVPDVGEPIAIGDVSATQVHTTVPSGRQATFTSTDTTLNNVWELMRRSALHSVQVGFVDTPTREKGQFLGDAANISYATMATQGERAHSEQAIREFLKSADRFWTGEGDTGRYNAVYPNVDNKRDIPDYSLTMVDWVWRYYLETGDERLLALAYPYLRQTADYVLRSVPTEGPTAGLVTQLAGGSGDYRYGIIDWPSHGRFGYDMGATARTTINAQSVWVLRVVADMAETLGQDGEVDALRASADGIADTMNATLRRPDGVYVDGLRADGLRSGHAGSHSTSYAIAFGIAPEAAHPALAEYLDARGMKQGPMTAHWLVQALQDAERPDAVLDLLTDRDDLGWARILDEGGTFTWEQWIRGESESHGWGAQSIVDVQDTILGLDVTAPAGAELAIAPPAIDLDEASGTRWTDRGPVSVEWSRWRGGTNLTTTVPVNSTARIVMPPADGAYVLAGGREPLASSFEDGQQVFVVGSGTTQVEYVPSFTNQRAPSIAGAARVGSTLRADAGTWSEAELTYGYQWQRDGADITGADTATYAVRRADAGHRLSVEVTGTSRAGTTAVATSAAVRVARLATSTRLAAGRTKVRSGQPVRFVVRVGPSDATGRVALRVDGRQVTTARLRDGRATVSVVLRGRGGKRVTARYPGSASHLPSTSPVRRVRMT